MFPGIVYYLRFLTAGRALIERCVDAEASLPDFPITIHDVNDYSKIKGTTSPPNFFTLQIDPLNGAVKSYRPMVN